MDRVVTGLSDSTYTIREKKREKEREIEKESGRVGEGASESEKVRVSE